MADLKYIFGKPELIQGFDEKHPITIYPIRLEDYEDFIKCSKMLHISRQHFAENPYSLLTLVFMSHEQLGYTLDELIKDMTTLLTLVTQGFVHFISNEYIEGFLLEDGNLISIGNYDTIRTAIMKQNLMFEQKVYKDPLVQEWADMMLENRAKKAIKITIEDMITTVKNYDGISYEQIMTQTVYQLHADFYRVCKLLNFMQSSLFATVGDTKIEHFAEFIDLFKSPYDNLFVTKDKLKNVNSIFTGQN